MRIPTIQSLLAAVVAALLPAFAVAGPSSPQLGIGTTQAYSASSQAIDLDIGDEDADSSEAETADGGDESSTSDSDLAFQRKSFKEKVQVKVKGGRGSSTEEKRAALSKAIKKQAAAQRAKIWKAYKEANPGSQIKISTEVVKSKSGRKATITHTVNVIPSPDSPNSPARPSTRTLPNKVKVRI